MSMTYLKYSKNTLANSRVILDSGAFSADQNNTAIDIEEYMQFIEDNDVELYFNLDVIGDWRATWENQEIMEKNGFSPIPIFHVEDPIECLYRAMDYKYMALGGMAGGESEVARERFLDMCFNKICDTKDRLPRCKVHGLGLASPMLVAKYPFYSADTASGIHYGRYGIIIFPTTKADGTVTYLRPPKHLYITERSTAQFRERKHFKTISREEQKWLLEYVKSRGFDWGKVEVLTVDKTHKLEHNERYLDKEHTMIERVVEDGIVSNHILRDFFNLDFYMKMEEELPEWPWPFKPKMNRLF